MIIALCGFMGSGKTTLGKILSEKLGWRFCDTDEYIEKMEGKSIPNIFAQYGEEYFRELEHKAIKELSMGDKIVLSLGGGLPISHKNKVVLKNLCVIYLDSSFESCYERIKNTDRPIVRQKTKEQLKKLFEDRKLHYKEVSKFVVASDNVKEMAEQIFEFVKEELQ